MRVLETYEIAAVGGGGFWAELGKIIATEIGMTALKDWYKKNIGEAGSNPPANETDNGGTSFGTGVCNTFGCMFIEAYKQDPDGLSMFSNGGYPWPDMLLY